MDERATFYIKRPIFYRFNRVDLCKLLRRWGSICVTQMDNKNAVGLEIITGDFYHIGKLAFIELSFLVRDDKSPFLTDALPLYFRKTNEEYFHPRLDMWRAVDALIERVNSSDPEQVTQLGYDLNQVREMNLNPLTMAPIKAKSS